MKKLMRIGFAMVFMMTVFTGCSSEGSGTIKMATKPMTEQYILGSMFQMLLEQETDLRVDITEGVGGGTSNIQPGMESAAFDMYPEYTGTGWNAVLKKDSLYTEDMFPQLQSGYQAMKMQWTGMIGFNNTYGLAVRKEIADKYQLKTYSDLKAVANQLTFGAEYDFFEREDGYSSLCQKYNLDFKKTMDLDIGLKYDAIRQKKIDIMNIFTTDGQLSTSDLVVLEDDLHLYPSYRCGFVIRDEILEKYPEIKKVMSLFEGLISDQEMATMNYQVEAEKKDPVDVAKAFLKSKGLIKE